MEFDSIYKTYDNDIYLNYDGIYSFHQGYGEEVVIDGKKKNAWIIEVKYNIWDKYIEPLYKQSEEQYPIYIDEIDNCDMIYYGKFDSENFTFENINSVPNEYEKILEK